MRIKNWVNAALFSIVAAGCNSGETSVETHIYDQDPDNGFNIPVLNIESCDVDMPNDEILAPYVRMLEETPGLKEAVQLCGSTESFQDTLWDKLKTVEETQKVLTADLPESIQTAGYQEYFIPATNAEAEDVYTAHVAHSLWLDKIGVLPWKLADYTEDELKELFDPLTWFWEWDGRTSDSDKNIGNGKFEFGYLVNHSPAETFRVLSEYIDVNSLTTQKQAVIDIAKALRYFRHSNTADYCDDTQVIETLAQMNESKVSTFGCQSMAPYFVSLAATINIPGSPMRGYYGGAGHRTAAFKFTNHVLAHADDVYTHVLWNTPTVDLMDSYDFWEENVLAYPQFSGLESPAAHNSRIGHYRKAAKYPAKLLMRLYCKDGRTYLDDFFSGTLAGESTPYLTAEEIDELQARIEQITNNCAEIPENNPDGNGSCDWICYNQDYNGTNSFNDLSIEDMRFLFELETSRINKCPYYAESN